VKLRNYRGDFVGILLICGGNVFSLWLRADREIRGPGKQNPPPEIPVGDLGSIKSGYFGKVLLG